MSGFPQLDFSTYPSQIFWLAVSFGALYIAVSKRVLPSIAITVEGRQNKLEDDIKRAQKFHSQAEQVKFDYEAGIESSRRQAAKILQEGAAKITAMQEERNRGLENKVADMMKEAEERITDLHQRVFAEMEQVATQAAEEILAKFIGKRVSNSDIKRHLKAS